MAFSLSAKPAKPSDLYFQPSATPLCYIIIFSSTRILTHTWFLMCCLRCCEFIPRNNFSYPRWPKYFFFFFRNVTRAQPFFGQKSNSTEINFYTGNKEAFKRFKIACQIPHCILPFQSGCNSREKKRQWRIRSLIPTTPM